MLRAVLDLLHDAIGLTREIVAKVRPSQSSERVEADASAARAGTVAGAAGHLASKAAAAAVSDSARKG